MTPHPTWKTCPHRFPDVWRTLCYPDTVIGYGAVRVCGACGAREWNDWTTTRIGDDFRILPPADEKDSDAKS